MARPAASPEQRELQRQRIRFAASELHQSEGISAVSIRAVAKKAGVSPGAIYSYFSSLSELMRSLWLEPVAQANRRLEAIAASIDDPFERIEALLNAYVDFALSEPEVYRGAVMYVRPTAAPEPEVAPIDEVPFHALLVAALESLGADDAALSAQLLWASLHGALALPINVEIYELDDPERLARAMVERLMLSLR